jgi:hypothetical protein
MPIRRTSNKSSYDSGFYNPEVYSDVGSRRVFAVDPLLNQFSGAAAAYSLRSLTLTVTTSVIRVRRSNDDTEADFNALQVIDGTLTSWVGANNGFIRTWYDQSGNSRHANQTTTNRQPQIVSSGSLLTDNGLPVIAFNTSATVGSAQNLTVSTFGLAHPFHLFSVFKFSALIGTSVTPSTILDGTVIDSIDFREDGTNFDIYSGAFLYSGPVGRSTNTGLYNVLFNTTNSSYRYNSSATASGNAGSTSPGGLIIANYNSAPPDRGAPARYSELVIYSSNKASVQEGIESNINSYYRIF